MVQSPPTADHSQHGLPPSPGPNETSNLGPGLPTTGNTRKDLCWSRTNSTLYSEAAFNGRAKTIPRCEYCLQEDHTATYCPSHPSRATFVRLVPNTAPAATRTGQPQRPPRTGKTHLTPSPPPGGTPRARYASILIRFGAPARKPPMHVRRVGATTQSPNALGEALDTIGHVSRDNLSRPHPLTSTFKTATNPHTGTEQ